MTQKENEMLAVLVERVNNIKGDTEEIKNYQQCQNGKISETMVKLAKTDEIAKEAQQSVINCRKYIDKVIVGVIGSAASAVIALIIALVNR